MTHRRALVFPVDDGAFGLTVDVVREVVVAPRVTPVPTTPASVLGVCNLRGVVLPVFDTGRLLRGAPLRDPAFAVVVRCWGDDGALVVSALPTLAAVGEQPVQPSETPGTAGTYAVDERLVTMLDPEALIAAAGLGHAGAADGPAGTGPGSAVAGSAGPGSAVAGSAGPGSAGAVPGGPVPAGGPVGAAPAGPADTGG
ncbi:MAG TPA: chemotaxis protein CheW [Pilimelia sp.]|nr:chemotaxis protein CheW [Pilimelia sp.]